MIKSISDLNYSTSTPPNAETWEEYRDVVVGTAPELCYVDGTFDMLSKIEYIKAINNFDEMKIALTALFNDRYEFVSHAICSPV